MKKIELSGVKLVEFSKFIGTLANMSGGNTVYFIIDKDKVYSDSYIESKTLIKSLRYNLNDFCANEEIEDTIKFTFFSGKKLKDAFSYMNGNDITCIVKYADYDGENYCSSLVLTDGKVNITLTGADPALIEFANVPAEAIASLTDITNAQSAFRMTSVELKQVKSLRKLDTNTHVTISVGDKISINSEGSFSVDISAEADQVVKQGEYPISKELLSLVEDNIYDVYPLEDTVVLKSADEKIINVISLVDLA